MASFCKQLDGFAAVVVAVALFQVVSAHSLVRRASVCYGEFGCFNTVGSLHALPENPEVIKTMFTLRVRGDSHSAVLHGDEEDPTVWPSTLAASDFSASKPTKIITHGYLDSGTTAWLSHMASELLKQGDYNVFITDWGHGSRASYPQATANSLLVAAQLGKLVKALQSEGADVASVHLIGHSLGAQISGNAGARCPGLGRITGLDPAEPYFKTDFDNSQRLDKSDAAFVDVIHTDGSDFNLLQGYGLIDPVGHLDFYPNGGVDQPGCTDSAASGLLGTIGGSHGSNTITCSHSRSRDYFTESINSGCVFAAHQCNSWDNYESGQCHGCPSGGCPTMGFHADESSARGSYYLSTAQSSPFCGREYFVEMDLSGDRTNGFGRIYLTFLGSTHNSREIEFTRENRHYHANDKEKHMLAIHAQVGTVTDVKVRFHRADGLASLGTSHHITVHRIIVEDAVSRSRTSFCTHDHALNDDRTQTFRSHSGC